MAQGGRLRAKKVAQDLHEKIPSRFKNMNSKIYLKLTVLQRGLIEKLIKRGKDIETKLLLAILGLSLNNKHKPLFPEIIIVEGESYPGDSLKLILPRTLLNQLFKHNLIKIKQEKI